MHVADHCRLLALARAPYEPELSRVLARIKHSRHTLLNYAMLLSMHWAGLYVGKFPVLKRSDATKTNGAIKVEIRLLTDMTKGRHAGTVVINAKLKAVLQAYADQARCVDRSNPFFASQKSMKSGFSANSLAQTFSLLYLAAGVESSSNHISRRSFLQRLANQGQPFTCLKN
jgi:integrase/recombinase XerD